MDVTAIRWESLALILGLAALAIWALVDATRDEGGVQESDSKDWPLMLEVRRPGKEPEVVRAEDGAVLGRSRECHVIFDDSTVSKEHARLHVNGHLALVEDLHSTNGTLVNGKAIDGPTALRRGDRIALGSNVIWFLGEVPPSARREHL